jgi:hypothetical protein
LFGAPSKSACAWRTLTTFPSSFFQRTPAVIGATGCRRTSLLQTRRTDQDLRYSRGPRRLLASCKSGCLSPLRLGYVGGSLLLAFPRRPPAHAAHTLPPWLGTMCLVGHCKHLCRCYPAATSREQDTFITTLMMALASPRLDLTTQASQHGSVCVAVRGS